MGRFSVLFLIGLLPIFYTYKVNAYTPTLGQQGQAVKWSGRVRLPLVGNPSNRNGLTDSAIYRSVVTGLQRWQAASGGSVTFEYWQGTDSNTYEANSEYNGLSSIYFASNARGTTGLSANVLGLTQVWYDTGSGEILEADIVLNDLNYRFTTNPTDTTGFGTGGGSGFNRNVFIENVITHELGHAFGLSHSGAMQAAMLFMESPEQAFLGCDEQVGIRALYPSDSGGARSAITGSIVTSSGSAVFGAQVAAISRSRGTVLATAMSDRNGQYALAALEPGTYFLMAEPFFAGSGALPGYYQDIDSTKICSGRPFDRTMLLSSSASRPEPITAQPGRVTQAPTITISCVSSSSGGAGAAINPVAGSGSAASAPVVYNGATDGTGFGFVDQFTGSSTLHFRINAVSGELRVSAMAYSLYSPVKTSVELLDEFGNQISVTSLEPAYEGSSGYVNHDSAFTAQGLQPGNYMIRVSGRSMSSAFFPAGPLAIDSTPFVVITGSVNEGAPPLADSLASNARCRMNESFPNYVSPPGAPERSSTDSDEDGRSGFCGTINRKSGDSGRGPGPGSIAGWFLPWAFMAAWALRERRKSCASPSPRLT